MSDSALRRVVRSTIGRRLLRSPTGFPGFGSTMSVPRPSSSCSPSSNIWLNMFAMLACSVTGPYLRSSPGMPSGPTALPLRIFFRACATSVVVMGLLSGFFSDSVTSSICGSKNRFEKCLAMVSAAYHI